jgi:hypothetical protein
MIRARFYQLSVALGMLFAATLHLNAQAKYAGYGPGSYVSVGVTASGFESDYGQRLLGGASVFLDANIYRRIGVEVEARQSRFHTDEDLRESTYLVGPKISTHGRTWRPYAKLLVGRGEFNFPFDYATGSSVVVAPGAGLDWRVAHSRVMVRIIDFEYQDWPQFTYGAIHPYGASAGVSFRVF